MTRLHSRSSIDPVRVAEPLFRAFVRSAHCPSSHARHALSTLPVLALFVAMIADYDEDGLSWGSLDPDELLAASIEIDPEELGFLSDLLDVSASFYGFLAELQVLPLATADRIRARLARLAFGLYRAAA